MCAHEFYVLFAQRSRLFSYFVWPPVFTVWLFHFLFPVSLIYILFLISPVPRFQLQQVSMS